MWFCWTRSRHAARGHLSRQATSEPAPGTYPGTLPRSIGGADGSKFRKARSSRFRSNAPGGAVSKFDGQTLCMTNTGKYVRGGTACSSLSDEGRASSAAWNFIPPSSTPYPEQCPWTGVRQCMSDRDCNFFGAPKGNPCTKCHIGSGSTLNICGPP